MKRKGTPVTGTSTRYYVPPSVTLSTAPRELLRHRCWQKERHEIDATTEQLAKAAERSGGRDVIYI